MKGLKLFPKIFLYSLLFSPPHDGWDVSSRFHSLAPPKEQASVLRHAARGQKERGAVIVGNKRRAVNKLLSDLPANLLHRVPHGRLNLGLRV